MREAERVPIPQPRSVLPRVAGVHVDGGIRLRQTGHEKLTILMSAVAFAGTVVGFLALVLTTALKSGGDIIIVAWCAIVFGAFSFSAFRSAFSEWLQRLWKFERFGSFLVTVRPWPLRLDEDATFDVLITRKAARDAGSVDAVIECVEESNINDNRRTPLRATTCSVRIPAVTFDATREKLHVRLPAHIPRNQPASLLLPGTWGPWMEVKWRLLVTVTSSHRSTHHEFPLLVLPQVPLDHADDR